MNPLLLTDGYKTGHHQQYPEGTSLVFSNFTPRSNKYAPKGCDKVVSFGQQMIVKQIYEAFDNDFFSKPKEEVCGEMKRELSMYLNTNYDVSHFEALHDLGYLPVEIRAIEEGNFVDIRVPVLCIHNTHSDFYWVTNYLETIISNLLWKPLTSATIASTYRKVLTSWMEKTDKEKAWFIDWQGHDFSMRGMDSVDAVISSGLGHATSFKGSDSLPVIHGARKYYGETGVVVGSVNATEHSVMCAGSKDDEIETFSRLLETYPTGILSIVSDTWDLWKVCTEHIVTLKEEILARDGKLVIRPDSGDPVDIICGENESYRVISKEDIDKPYILPEGQKFIFIEESSDTNQSFYTKTKDGYIPYERLSKNKGVIELLWEVFGGTITDQGYKVLDPHIGAIYGDSITIDRANEICKRLEAKGFASTNIVLGVGSFTYQYNTRDTFGFAMKATYVEVLERTGRCSMGGINAHNGCPDHGNGEICGDFEETCVSPDYKLVGREIFKDPITDDGVKKSAKGLLMVTQDADGHYILKDQVSWADVNSSENKLQVIFKDGKFYNETTLTAIRQRLGITA